MRREKILYTITTEDVRNVSDEVDISFANKDLHFIQDKIGDFFGQIDVQQHHIDRVGSDLFENLGA